MKQKHEYLIIEDGTIKGVKHGMELSEVVIPDGVTAIGEFAFSNCDSLERVQIPESVKEIGECAFFSGHSYATVRYGGTKAQWNSIAGLCNNTDILTSEIICADGVQKPEKRGILLTSGSIVYGRTEANPSSLEIPDDITAIGVNAFCDCDSLEHVQIPESVKEIGSCAFSFCKSLKDIKIPDGVVKIEAGVFSVCYSLVSVEIPASVTTIVEGFGGAFFNCKSLATVRYGGTKAQWNSIADLYNNKELLNAEVTCADGVQKPEERDTLLISGSIVCGHTDAIPVSLEIPDGITAIGYGAFSHCDSLKSVKIPASVREVGDEAFFFCKSLVDVVIPENVKYLGVSAFSNCTSLKSIEIPKGVKVISACLFDGCKSLTSVVIPDGVEEICTCAFEECSKLKRVEIPKGVTKIEEHTFCDCVSLSEVMMPEGVTNIDSNAFHLCESLTSVVIPDSVEEIGYEAFYGCKSLKHIEIPASVTTIGWGAFDGCESLSEVRYSGTKAQWNSIAGLYDGRDKALLRATVVCTDRMQKIEVMPDGFALVGSILCWTRDIPKIAEIPEGVTAISPYAFDCKPIKSVKIPASVKEIGGAAFYGCKSLTDVMIPESVQKIGHEAFYGCKSLKHIEIPASVTEIGENAFVKCRKKLVVRYGGTRAQWEKVTANAAFDKGAVIQCTDGEIEIREKPKLDN
ncbi:MAG: leucine-rich repeat domain-containing protein [Treponemataceae bacterium]|nr:leucine-rich repeat domain-containing protein [Treponemataceae bacterium]